MVDRDFWLKLAAARGSRRDLFALGGALAGVAAASRAERLYAATPRWRPAAYPFTLGVASGDPLPDSVVLWTRLAPDPLRGGGMPPEPVKVRWEVARDPDFRGVVRRGEATATPAMGHSVHVEADELEAGRPYWYRFIAGGDASPVGRTRTAPRAGAQNVSFPFAFASCQHYEYGHFTAHRHLAEEDLELVVHLGDYIYEYGIGQGRARLHDGPEIMTLDAYRNRYALYKSDPDLQAAHHAHPFIVTWDDHEVENNHAGAIAEDTTVAPATFLQRRAAAYQAYYEHMPLRPLSRPKGSSLRLYRRHWWGQLVMFSVLDTRQFRDDQPCNDGNRVGCAAAADPARTITGADQERWLLKGLDRTKVHWNVIANQLPFIRWDSDPGPDERLSMDKWDGYQGSRQRVTEFLRRRRPANPVIITGDVHQNFVADVKADYRNPASETLAAELIGTSISSGGDGGDSSPGGETLLRANPHIKFHDNHRGYVRCAVTRERLTADYRVVSYVTRPGAPVSTRASFVVESGRPGVEKV